MRWLTGRGAVAALAVGVATIWGLGWRGLALLLAFFVSSSLLTAAKQRQQGGGIARNARQVVANGGVAALAALAGSWTWFAGALAAANADTWATEIGRHSRAWPRLISSWRQVPAGTDGGMTLLGTSGGVAGAAFVAGLAGLLRLASGAESTNSGWFVAVVAFAGFAGMVLDSLLGATIQGKARWMDNDAVNLAATLTGALLAGLIA